MSRAAALWSRVGTRFLPFADAATATLPQHPPKPSTMMDLFLTTMGTRLCSNYELAGILYGSGYRLTELRTNCEVLLL